MQGTCYHRRSWELARVSVNAGELPGASFVHEKHNEHFDFFEKKNAKSQKFNFFAREARRGRHTHDQPAHARIGREIVNARQRRLTRQINSESERGSCASAKSDFEE
jgi:hypothetical protein